MKIWDFIFCEHTYVVSRSKDTLEATEMDMGIDLDTTHTHMFTIDNHICLKPGQNYCANSINIQLLFHLGPAEIFALLRF